MTSQTWTIREVLVWATNDFAERGIESPRLDAELLVAKGLQIDRVGLYLDLDRPLTDAERRSIRQLISRRREREPVAYILGHRDFYGRRFRVTSEVLIPRPDTETLVELALQCIPEGTPSRVLDVGTGSGAIAVTIAAERALTQLVATDVSEAALEIARDNAQRFRVADRIRFEVADICGPADPFDLIVSNPPYIALAEIEHLQIEVREHEPRAALEAGKDGLEIVAKLIRAAVPLTARGSQLLIEVGHDQARPVLDLARAQGGWELVAVHPDLNRVERVVHLRRT